MEQITYSQDVIALLVSCGLPVTDLCGDGDVLFSGLRDESELLAIIGIEMCGDYGLLRSLAISPAHRGDGLGHKLVAFAEKWAISSHLKALYLLTTTADNFFGRLGYLRLPRSEAPDSITKTTQFAGLCPDSSIFMGKRLGTDRALYQEIS